MLNAHSHFCGRPELSMNIEQYLAENGRLIYSNKGTSMLPLLREGRDLMIIDRKSPERCRAGDVVLFRRGSDYVLHRVVEVRENGYVILGDNCVSCERGVTDRDILGVMTGFVRNGREHSVNEWSYKVYTFLWMRTAALRIFVKKVIQYVRTRLRVSHLVSAE